MVPMLAVLTGCGEPPATADEGTKRPGDSDSADGTVQTGDPGKDPPVGSSTNSGDDDASTPDTASAVVAKLGTCTTKVSASAFANNAGGSPAVDICQRGDAVYFTADMDIDCDGQSSTVCNETEDPDYQSETAATDSKGKPLDAATLPYIVVPGVSSRWSYKASGIAMGTVAAVIYNGKIEYGIVGDVGPTSAIGEVSYAMAKRLGINPNPRTGGVSSGVTYVIFPKTRVPKKEDHAAAVAVGAASVQQFLGTN